jgi:hypothetical protein
LINITCDLVLKKTFPTVSLSSFGASLIEDCPEISKCAVKNRLFHTTYFVNLVFHYIVIKNYIIALMMEAARTSETSVDNYFTQQYIPEDKSELHTCQSIFWHPRVDIYQYIQYFFFLSPPLNEQTWLARHVSI